MGDLDPRVDRRVVLVVEDEEDIAYLLRFWLEGDARCAGIHQASTPQTAVSAARRARPDTILLDFMLVGGTAADCLPELRAVLPGARIIVYTANLQAAHQAGVLALGATCVVEKMSVVVEDVVDLALATC
jgi:two-component system nitrate/nitrite response regulator NarL